MADRDTMFLDRMNKVEFAENDLVDFNEFANDRRHPDGPSFEGMVGAAADFFEGEPEKVAAAMFRMEAVANIFESGALGGWAQPKLPDGCVLTQEAVLKAAASEPLQNDGKRVVFGRDSFLERVMLLAEEDGSA